MFEAVPNEEMPPRWRLIQTLMVVGLLAVASVVFSYLGAFAVTTVLVNADLLEKWPPGTDPRPRWMMLSLAYIGGSFATIAMILKWTIWRQLKRLDATSEDDPDDCA